MKRLVYFSKLGICFLLLFVFTSELAAQRYRGRKSKATTFKVGYFNPKDAKEGVLFGINLSGMVDETVDLGFGIDLFHRSYQKDSEVAVSVTDGGLVERQLQRDLDFSTTAIPLMGTVTVKLGSELAFSYFLGGGLGYSLLWNKESNYIEDVSEKRFYHGLSWKIGGGAMYQLGSRSYLVGEIFYNDALLKRDKGETPNGLPVWSEVNLSGFSFSLGIRIQR
jgi:hypothetical protein